MVHMNVMHMFSCGAASLQHLSDPREGWCDRKRHKTKIKCEIDFLFSDLRKGKFATVYRQQGACACRLLSNGLSINRRLLSSDIRGVR